MKTKHILYFALVALVSVACNKELAPVVADEDSGVPMSFNVTREMPGNDDPELKASLSGLSVVWTAGEKLSIIDGEVVASPTTITNAHNKPFTAVSGGSKVTTFDGSCDDVESYYAISPYFKTQAIANSKSKYHYFNTVKSDTLSTILPYRQTATIGSFDPDALIMVGKSDPANKSTINMKQLCALLKFTLAQSDVASIEFSGRNGERLTGPVSVKFDASGIPVIDGSNTILTDGGFLKEMSAKHVVMLPPSGETTIAAGTYYMALPPVAFTKGISIRFMKANGTIAEKIGYSALTLERAGIFDIGTIDTSTLVWQKAIYLPFVEYPRNGAIKFPLSTASAAVKPPFSNGYYDNSSWPDSSVESKWGTSTAWYTTWLNKEVAVTTSSNIVWLGSTYTFNLFATSYVSPHQLNGLRMGMKSGGTACHITLPGIAGKKLFKVAIVGGAACSLRITDESGVLVSGGTAHSFTIGDEYTYVLSGTTAGTTYRITANSSLTIRSMTLYFADADGTGIPLSVSQAVTRTSSNSFTEGGTSATLKAGLVLKDNSVLSDGSVSFGFEYRPDDSSEWTSVTCSTGLTSLNTFSKNGVKYYCYSCDVTGLGAAKENRYRAWAKGNNDAARVYGATKTVYSSKKVMAIYFADALQASDNWLFGLRTINEVKDGTYFNSDTDFDWTFESPYTFHFHGNAGLSKSTGGNGTSTSAIIFSPKSTSLTPAIGGTENGYVGIPAISGKKLTKVTVYVGSDATAEKAKLKVTTDATGSNVVSGGAIQAMSSKTHEISLTGTSVNTAYYLHIVMNESCTDFGVSQLRFQFE